MGYLTQYTHNKAFKYGQAVAFSPIAGLMVTS